MPPKAATDLRREVRARRLPRGALPAVALAAAAAAAAAVLLARWLDDATVVPRAAALAALGGWTRRT
jgi:hypothetical protein